MSRTSVRSVVIAAILIISTAQAAPLYADAKTKSGPKKVTSSPSISVSKGTWIQPSSKKTPVIAQAGRSLPMKFTLIGGAGPLLTTDMVSVSLSSVSSCTTAAATQTGSATVLVAPTPYLSTSPSSSPTASPSVSLSPSASASPSSSLSSSGSSTEIAEREKSSLRVEKGIFIFNWKVPKNLTTGCYRITAGMGDVAVTSPIIRVKSSK